jgi:energy-coupling factor transporter ATP-binding protein EcfA2
MQYNQKHFIGAKPAGEKYIKNYLLIKNYFNSQGFTTLITKPFLGGKEPTILKEGVDPKKALYKYYKEPLTNHSFHDGNPTDEFVLSLLKNGEIGLGVYCRQSSIQKNGFLSIIDVDSLSGTELEMFKEYIDSKNLPYVVSGKGVHIYGTSDVEVEGRNGVTFKIGNFTISGEIRAAGSGYCVVPPTFLQREVDNTIGNYSIGNSAFLELIMSGDPIPRWEDDILSTLLNLSKEKASATSRVEDMLKILKGTKKGKGVGVYDMNLREIGRIIRNIKKKKDITLPENYKEGLELALKYNKLHDDGYPDKEVAKTYDDVYKKELSKIEEFKPSSSKIPKVERDLEILKNEGIKVVSDKNTGEVYLRVDGETSMMLGSDICTRWITTILKPENKAQIANIEMRLNAMSEEEIDIRSRVSRNGGVLYNLNNGGKVVKIIQTESTRGVEGSWEVLDGYYLERFKTVSGEGVQVIPNPNATVDDIYRLFKYMNFEERYKPLIVCILIAYLIPDIAYPILNIYGEKGSGKSTMACLIKKLIDPNQILLDNAEFKKDDDLIITLNNGHLTVFDNIRRITADFGDMLTKVSTGIGFRGRTLFTNKGVTTFTFKKPVILTSVAQEMQREDLLSRSILIESIPFTDNIIPEGEMYKRFQAESDLILGSLFTIMSKIDVGSVSQTGLIRLTDFHIISRAVEKVMNWDNGTIDNLLLSNMEIQEEESFENSEIGEEIKNLIDGTINYPIILSTPDLYKTLCEKNSGFERKIKNARTLGRELGKIKQTMERLGYKVDQVRTTNERGWSLSK